MTRIRKWTWRAMAAFLCLSLLVGTLGAAGAAVPETTTLGIYSTAEMSGRCYSQNPLDGSAVTGSYLRVSTAMQQERKLVNTAILIDGGDALTRGLGGESGMTGDSGGKDSAVAMVLRHIGYDLFVPGETEFRYAPAVRDAFFRSLSRKNSSAGAPVSVLSANFLEQRTQTPVETPYQVTTVQVGKREFRIGVLGMGNIDAPGQIPQRYYEGHSFAHKGNAKSTYAYEWTNYWQKQLRGVEKCDFVAVVCHGTEDQIRGLAEATTGIDLLLAGHSGQAESYTLKNSVGKDVPCVTGGGQALTKTVLTLSSSGSISVGESTLLALSDYTDDGALTERLRPYYAKEDAFLSQPVGTLTGAWETTTTPALLQSDVTDLMGRAMLWASGADAALVTPSWLGTLDLSQRTAEKGDPVLTGKDCFALYPMQESTLYAVALTGAQIKAWLEQGSKTYRVTEDKIVQGGGEGADVLYGMDYELYLGNALGERVVNLTHQGKPVEDTQVFQVAVDSGRLTTADGDDPYDWFTTTGVSLGSDKIVWNGAASSALAASGGTLSAALAAFLKYETAQVGYVAPERESRWFLYPGASNGPITRLELVTMLYELAGKPTPGADAAFTDVIGNSAVVWAAETGIVSGNGKGKFFPGQSVTREQAAVMIYGYAKSLGLKPSGGGSLATILLDYGEIAVWARPAVDFCFRTEIIPAEGLRKDLFLPRQTLTRDQSRQVLRMLEQLIG